MSGDTISKLFKQTSEKYWDKKIALRYKNLGVWQPYTWKYFWEQSKYFGLGLTSMGLKAGDRVTIVGDNEPEWYFAQFGVICCGGIPTGAFQDSGPEEIKYVITQSGSTFVVVEDQEQVDKLIFSYRDREGKEREPITSQVPAIEKVIFWDTKGLRSYRDSKLMRFDEVVELGRHYEKEHPGLLEKIIENSDPEAPVMLTYSSGTTGLPKGIVHCSRSVLAASRCWDSPAPTGEKDEFVSFFPLAYGGEFLYVIPAFIKGGATVNFPEEPETVAQNIRELGPTKASSAPRLLEMEISTVQVKMADASLLKRLAYQLFMPVGYKIARMKRLNQSINVFWKAVYGLGYFVVYRPLRDWLAYPRNRILLIGGAALASEVLDFYLALGIDARMIYGMIECTPTAGHMKGDVDPETTGVPTLGSELRISDGGEVLSRGPQRMLYYHQNPEATRKLIDEQGWVHTSDAGFITEKGHLVCIDRLADLGVLGDGTGFSPSYIENKLKFSPYIRDAIITGDDKDYVGALISIDFPNLGQWAEAHRIPYTTFVDLSQKPEVYELVSKDVVGINRKLPEKHRIRKFAILHKELDADDAELTRTRKLRRKEVSARYQDMIEALYSDKTDYTAEARVTYRDGRTATITTKVHIASVEGEAK
ncbi:MAG: long-chain fatty acid--CoA ligase [Chloroflexi bacterium]|nr:long-chain fatty acid--CoA ligase [Chloroflexota bacterium]MBM3154466.1 long-chain fatty acid--CoA ligase [Chloroflexota bacterium]MBM3172249.1 long-chain fatty acid--CoA ligase [Chloroflexota bacterium]MBM3174651.1 long-chain fatty acid--CoA ligase [Chloroflexota bacterium]MBM4450018.1 long-chain fatty acid--CoA ligase [Chloroflexota bacterium]